MVVLLLHFRAPANCWGEM